ncbi:MAG: hypothetical protein ACEQSC_01735, partial [Candidatus Nanopelagicaceae bacterium]
MSVTAVVSGNTIVVTRDDINKESVYPITAIHLEKRKRGTFKEVSLFSGFEELVRVSDWEGQLGFGNSIFSLTDPDAISVEAQSALGVAGGGGGGGGTSLTQPQTTAAIKSGLDTSDDIEAIKTNPIGVDSYKVVTAHTVGATNFTVGQELREFIKPDGSSIWRLPDSTAALSTAPTRGNLEPIGSASAPLTNSTISVIDWRVEIAHDPFTIGQELRQFIASDGTSKWREVGSTVVLTTPPTRAKLARSGFADILDSIDASAAA